MKDHLCKSITDKVVEIKDCILSNIQSYEPQRNASGIMGEEFGILLFLHHYARTMNDDEVARIAQHWTEHIVDTLSDTTSASYCDGWAGILLCFDYLRENGFIDVETDDIIADIENSIADYTTFCISNKVYEFLYGASGVGFYWLSKDNRKMIDYIVSSLYQTKESDCKSSGYKWKMQGIKFTDAPDYNLSMSHGLVGLLLFLLRAFEKYGDSQTEDMLVGGINYLLAQRNTRENSLSIFPSRADDPDSKNSRLAWCYGDFGCAYLLEEASVGSKRTGWMNAAIDIYKHASLRRTQSTSMVSDAGLCHGSAGISMMFRNIADKCNGAVFGDCADYWMQETLKLGCFPDGLAGYKTQYINTWYNDLSLLTGVSGIGLAMLSYIDPQCRAAEQFLLK